MSNAATGETAADVRLGAWLRGKYRLDRVLGEGGMAVVYAATHRNNKRFAVKVLHGALSANNEMRGRFLREGYLANTVDHPGAVAVLDDDVSEDGSAFLVMELLQGVTVESFAPEDEMRPSLPVALNLAHQLLDTLASAHQKGIVHRDIKPANLFLTEGGQLKVLDFGIARLAEPGTRSSVTQTGMTMGSPAFMGPEQALGKRDAIDARTDIWAVGASLFWLLTGRQPHLGETVQYVMVMAATTPVAPLASIWTDAPADVAAIVDRALAFDPAARFQSAAEMRDAIAAAYLALVGQPVSPAALNGLARGAVLSRRPPLPPPAMESDPSFAATRRSDAVTPPPSPTSTAGYTPVPVSSNRTPPRAWPAVAVGVAVAMTLATSVIAFFALRTDPGAEPSHVAAAPPPVAREPPPASPPPVEPAAAPATGAPVASEAPPASASAPSARPPPPPPPVHKHQGATSPPARAVPTTQRSESDFDRQ